MTPTAARAMYARLVEGAGEPVTLRRIAPGGATTDATVFAKVSGFEPNELVGGIQEGDRRIVLLAEDLEAAGWPGEPRDGDRLLVRGKVLGVRSVDASTRRIAGVVIAYDLVARG